MTQSHIIWSGQACPFRRAGVYYGVCGCDTHEPVARWLLPRRGSLYGGGRVRIRPGASAPLCYFAVRDPSAVRIVPVRNGGRAGGAKGEEQEFAHISLVFPVNTRGTGVAGGLSPREAADLATLARQAEEHEQGAFVVTVGLRADREAEFHERLVLASTDLPYAQLCERIMALRDEFSN